MGRLKQWEEFTCTFHPFGKIFRCTPSAIAALKKKAWRRIEEHIETRQEYMTLMMALLESKRAGHAEGVKEGIEIGAEKKGRSVILTMLKHHMSIDNIAVMTDSPIPYVKEVAREAGYSV